MADSTTSTAPDAGPTAPSGPTADRSQPSAGRGRHEGLVAALATAIACLPVAVAALRAALGDWVPIGDDAYFTVRSMDVLTSHHPLVGAWSSGSTDLSHDVNNLGPLQLDLMAPFTKLAPMGGTAIAVGAVHIAAIVTVAWLVRRIAGPLAVVPAMAGVSLMTWVLGSEMLVSARQHQFLLLSFLVVLVAAWAAAAGDRWAMVPFVAAGSLVTQTHLSYPILVAALAVPAIAGQVVAARRQGVGDQFARPWIVAAGLAVVLWSQTLIDEFFGWGNLTAVLSSPGGEPSVGPSGGLRIVADVIVSARGYSRPGYAQYDPNQGLAGDLRTAAFVVLVVAVAAAAVIAWHRRRCAAAAGLAVMATALVAGVVDAASLPVGRFGITPANHRWLWPIACLGVLGTMIAAHRAATRRRPDLTGAATSAFGVVLVVLSVANLPASEQVLRPDLFRDQIRSTSELTTARRSVDLEGPVVIDQSHLYFGHPFAYPIAAELVDRGIEFRLEGEMQARRFGESRVADGTEPTRLVLWHADDARARVDDPATVVFVDGLDPIAVELVRPAGSEDGGDG